MSEELLPQQTQIHLILAELDIKRKELERRDQELVNEAVQRLVSVGLAGLPARFDHNASVRRSRNLGHSDLANVVDAVAKHRQPLEAI